MLSVSDEAFFHVAKPFNLENQLDGRKAFNALI